MTKQKDEGIAELLSENMIEGAGGGSELTQAASGPTIFTDVNAQPAQTAAAVFNAPVSEPFLVSATVRFQTLNDDKKRNSVVTVTVRDATNAVIAYVDNIFDEFKDQRNYGPYDMHVMKPVAQRLVRPGGSITLYFVQNSNDEWHTNFLVDLAFSDGSHIAVEEQDLSFTGDHPKQVFGV